LDTKYPKLIMEALVFFFIFGTLTQWQEIYPFKTRSHGEQEPLYIFIGEIKPCQDVVWQSNCVWNTRRLKT
jgi:hypothetical protein